MSRGIGAIQRRLVETLEQHEGLLDTFELAAHAYGLNPDTALLEEAQLVAVRRALRGLARKGVIADLGRRGWSGGRRRWANLGAAARYRERTKAAFGAAAEGAPGML